MRIKKGKHGNIHLPRIVSPKKELKRQATFTDSCRYDIGDDQSDINKLYGIGFLPWHRKNSIRFGWRYVKETDKIEILAYWYINSTRYNESICFVDINQKCAYSIKWIGNGYELKVDDISKTINMGSHNFGLYVISILRREYESPT
jgi:hypothetical protein